MNWTSDSDESLASTRDVRLTRRQREVLQLLATGMSNRGIAEQLGLSLHTVESHLHYLYGKLGVVNRGAAIRYAIDNGIP